MYRPLYRLDIHQDSRVCCAHYLGFPDMIAKPVVNIGNRVFHTER